jgi:hypothetical protein
MSQQQRDNSGAIFKNNTAGKGDNFPGYGGSCMIEGREYFISAWVKESTRGKFFSLAGKRPLHARISRTRFRSDDRDPTRCHRPGPGGDRLSDLCLCRRASGGSGCNVPGVCCRHHRGEMRA